MVNSTKFNKNSTTYKYICEMFLDGVNAKGIAKHLKISAKVVREVLLEKYDIDYITNYRPGPDPALIFPNVQNDVFLCQLALLANIDKKTFNNFVEKVRDLNLDIIQAAPRFTGTFRKTPDLEFDKDIFLPWY